jgi:hypothetical protein
MPTMKHPTGRFLADEAGEAEFSGLAVFVTGDYGVAWVMDASTGRQLLKLEMPDNLKAFSPNDHRKLPLCPAALDDIYSAGYEPVGSKFTVMCTGNHHGTPGHPRHTSSQLFIRPQQQ